MANAMPRITIQGDFELIQLVNSVPDRVLTECSKAMRKVAKPIIAHARGLLRRQHGLASGLLKKSIGVRALRVDRKKKAVYMYVGPRGPGKQGFISGGTAQFDKNGKYVRTKRKHIPLNIAHLIEYGHRIAVNPDTGRSQKNFVMKPKNINQKKAASAGFVKARPFLRPAVDANKGNFTQAMKDALKIALAKRAAKAGAP